MVQAMLLHSDSAALTIGSTLRHGLTVKKDVEAAEACLRFANTPSCYYEMGMLQTMKEGEAALRFVNAFEYFEKAIQLSPKVNTTTSYFQIGLLRRQLGEDEATIAAWEKGAQGDCSCCKLYIGEAYMLGLNGLKPNAKKAAEYLDDEQMMNVHVRSKFLMGLGYYRGDLATDHSSAKTKGLKMMKEAIASDSSLRQLALQHHVVDL
jgi:TPR repeat protein